MHGLTGGSWKRNKDRTRATEMKDTRGNLAVTSGSETYRRSSSLRQLSTLLRARYQMTTGPKVLSDAAERTPEPLGLPRRGEAFHHPFPDPGRLMGVLGPVEFSTDVKCCDDSGGRFMLVAERAMPWSAWRLLSWHARSARCVVDVCGG